MARRRDKNIALGIVQLVGMLVALSLLYPAARQFFFSFGMVVAGVILLLLAGVIGFLIIRKLVRAQQAAQRPAAQSPATPVMGYSYVPSSPPPASLQCSPPAPRIQAASSMADLVQQLRTIDWFQFEKVVEAVFRKVGYGVERRGGANPDGGIDLVIEKDGEQIAVQCKHWKTWRIGVKEVRELLGALTDFGIKKGTLIILGGFTSEAKQLADKHGIEIIQEKELARLLEAVDARFDPEFLAILTSKEKICPRCEQQMVLRTGRKGANPGSQFWGCSSYPRCRFTMPA